MVMGGKGTIEVRRRHRGKGEERREDAKNKKSNCGKVRRTLTEEGSDCGNKNW